MKQFNDFRNWRQCAILAAAMMLVLDGQAQRLAAQEVVSPDISGFRLPGAASRPSTQGPVDDDNPVVRNSSGKSEDIEPQAAPQPREPVAASQPPATARPAPANPASRPSAPPAISSAAVQPAATLASPAADQPTPLAGETNVPDVAETQAPPAPKWNVHSAAGRLSVPLWQWLALLGLALVAALATWLILARRKSEMRAAAAAPVAERETLPVRPRPAPIAPPMPPRVLDPLPDPVKRPAAPVARPTPVQPMELEITLAAQRMSATLLNTALSYQISITNRSAEPFGPLTISGDMIAAHASIPERDQIVLDGAALAHLHRIESLAPGESATLAGDLRLPLSSITPIRSGDAALFVPLARFRTRAERPGGAALATDRTFVIGEAPAHAEAALKPFRLDLGPRLYSQIGQREVAS